jgi:hypothetical protein
MKANRHLHFSNDRYGYFDGIFAVILTDKITPASVFHLPELNDVDPIPDQEFCKPSQFLNFRISLKNHHLKRTCLFFD